MRDLRGTWRRPWATRLVAALVAAAPPGACGGDDDGADVREIDGGSGSASGSASRSAPADRDAKVEPEDVAAFDEATLQEIARTLAEPTLALL